MCARQGRCNNTQGSKLYNTWAEGDHECIAYTVNWSAWLLSFSISPPLSDVLDISQVASNFGGSFMGVVQYDMDNTAFEVSQQQFASLQLRAMRMCQI